MANHITTKSTSNTPIIVATLVALGMTLATILGLVVLRPHEDNSQLIASILSIAVPTAAALGAFLKASQATVAVLEVRHQINSRMDEFLELTAKASRAEGRIEGIEVGKDTKNVHRS